jgi:hypothetical protein
MAAKKKAAKNEEALPPRYVADEEEPKAEAEPEPVPKVEKVAPAPKGPVISDEEIRRRKRLR